MSSTDIPLMERWIRRRDARAFNEIVVRYSALVHGTCRRVLGNDADAEDVTQDCFLRLARATSPPQRSLGGWLHSLATHQALDYLKAQARRRRREERFAASRQPADEPHWNEVQELVDDAIEALPEDLRSVIVAHFLEQRSQESIARELGLSRQTVTYRISKGIEKVRRRLERHGVAVGLAALSTMLSTNLVEAVPASVKAALGKLALSGATAVGVGAAGTATTLGILGGIGAMYKIVTAAALAIILVVILAYTLTPWRRDSDPPSGAGVVAPAAAVDRGDAEADSAVLGEAAGRQVVASEPLDPGRLIRGRVVDLDDEVVPEAAVAAGVEGGEKLVEATADATGLFELTFPEAGRYAVCAFKEGVGLGSGGEAETGGAEIKVTLEPLGSISGRVFDGRTGEGNDDIELSLSYYGHYHGLEPDRAQAWSWLDVGWPGAPTRGPGGRYRFENLLASKYLFKLAVDDTGHVAPGTFGEPRVELLLVKGETREGFDLVLAPAGAVSGRVFDPGGRPLPGVRAHITSSKHSIVEIPPVETDDEGRYRFGGLAVGGAYAVVVDADGLAQSHSETITLAAPQDVTDLDIHMCWGHSVFGRVVDEDGEGIAGARFCLSKEQWSSMRGFAREETVTADDGSFRVDRVGPGEYSLCPRADGYESSLVRSLTMPADRDLHDQVFVLERKAEGFVSGRVTDAAGNPLAEIGVHISNDRRGPHVQDFVRTDGVGFFRFEELGRAKSFMVSARAEGYCLEERTGVPLNATDVDFTLERHASVVGMVVDAGTGEPVRDFEVRPISYRNRPNGLPALEWTPLHSETGEFVLDEIEAPRSAIEVRARGYAPFVTERIEIRSEETVEVEIRLERGASIAGRVVYAATGEPLPGVRVRAYDQGYFHAALLSDRRETSGGDFEALTTTDEEGHFELAGIDPQKELDLVAWRDGLETRILVGLRAPREQEIRMHPEGRLVARVRSGPEPVKGVLVSVSLSEKPVGGRDYWHGLWTSAEGTVEHSGLPAGRYTVFVRTADDERLGTLRQDIRAGETAEFDIDLQDLARRFAKITGAIDDVVEIVNLSLSRASDPEKNLAYDYCTSEKATFRFGGIPPGEYILRARRGVSGDSRRTTERRVTLRAGEELEVDIDVGK